MISFVNLFCVLLTYVIANKERVCAKKNNFGKHLFIFVYFMIKTKTC